MNTVIKNAQIVSDGKTFTADVLIKNQIIEKIAPIISEHGIEVDAKGLLLLPGVIDDQVHFREPGLTYKGSIFSESRAAVAGGTTTYIEQPNTIPQATTIQILEEKFALAAKDSFANYSFNLGASNDNLDEILKADYATFSGIKIFMGSSTGNMLVDNESVLDKLFANCPHLLITHCEEESIIKQNLEHFKNLYGENLDASFHPLIRNEDACITSTKKAIQLAKKHNSRLHVYHISTKSEAQLFENTVPLAEKRITAEACIHHLWFSDADYKSKGNFIKWNPSIKTTDDRDGVWEALLDNRIDVIATDHAPHTIEEKNKPYLDAPSGGPLVQHSLLAILEKVRENKISIERLVEKMCHNPAILFRIEKRGYIREGYFADLVLVDQNKSIQVSKNNLLYHCGWSPFDNQKFNSQIRTTWVNGEIAWNDGKITSEPKGQRIKFLTF
jgi:dihydroorotase